MTQERDHITMSTQSYVARGVDGVIYNYKSEDTASRVVLFFTRDGHAIAVRLSALPTLFIQISRSRYISLFTTRATGPLAYCRVTQHLWGELHPCPRNQGNEARVTSAGGWAGWLAGLERPYPGSPA